MPSEVRFRLRAVVSSGEPSSGDCNAPGGSKLLPSAQTQVNKHFYRVYVHEHVLTWRPAHHTRVATATFGNRYSRERRAWWKVEGMSCPHFTNNKNTCDHYRVMTPELQFSKLIKSVPHLCDEWTQQVVQVTAFAGRRVSLPGITSWSSARKPGPNSGAATWRRVSIKGCRWNECVKGYAQDQSGQSYASFAPSLLQLQQS